MELWPWLLETIGVEEIDVSIVIEIGETTAPAPVAQLRR